MAPQLPPSLPAITSDTSAQSAKAAVNTPAGMTIGSIIALVVILLLIASLLIFLFVNREYVIQMCCKRKTAVAEVAGKDSMPDPLDDALVIVHQEPRSAPPRLKRRPIEYSDELPAPTNAELERLQIARAKEEKKKRVAHTMKLAVARFGRRHLALGFTTWKDNFLTERHMIHLLKRAVGGLARPKVAAAVKQWKAVWVAYEQARAVAEMRKAEAEALAQQKAPPQHTKTWSQAIWSAIVPEDDE